MSDSCYDWMNASQACPDCKWEGLGKQTKIGEGFNDGAERHCPRCFHYLGYVAYPLISEALTDPRASRADRLQAEIIKHRLERDARTH